MIVACVVLVLLAFLVPTAAKYLFAAPVLGTCFGFIAWGFAALVFESFRSMHALAAMLAVGIALACALIFAFDR